MKILITGATGSLGQSLIAKLVNEHELFLLGRNSKIQEGVVNVHIDLSSDFSVKELPKNIDAIIHLAQSKNFRNFPDMAKEIFEVNTLSTLRLLDYAKTSGIKKFIYASSGGIYGNRDTGFNEQDSIPVDDLGFYLGSKLCSEIILDSYKSQLDIQILRFFFVYGPNQDESMLIPRLIHNIKQGNEIQLLGDSGIEINPIYVDDAAKAVVQSLKLSGSNKVNVAGSEDLSFREICDEIGRQVGSQPNYKINSSNSKKPSNLLGNNDKMNRILVKPEVSFAEGINKMLQSI